MAPANEPPSTPGGPVPAVLLCLAPILVLLAVTVIKPLQLPSRASLPLAAVLMLVVRTAYLVSDPLDVVADALAGCLEAAVPLSVVFGAILLFQTMQHTKCLPWMMSNIKHVSAGNALAEVMLIGWAFAYMIEGIGGFGAPVALAAPMLVSLGHDPILSVVVMVVLNALCSHLGSVGMVVWFGFAGLNLGPQNILRIGAKAASLVGAATFVVAPLAIAYLVPWRSIARSWAFVLLSLLSAVVPTFGVSLVSQDFPVVIGGLAATLCTGLLVYFKVGLRAPADDSSAGAPAPPAAPQPQQLKDAAPPGGDTGGAHCITMQAAAAAQLGLRQQQSPFAAAACQQAGAAAPGAAAPRRLGGGTAAALRHARSAPAAPARREPSWLCPTPTSGEVVVVMAAHEDDCGSVGALELLLNTLPIWLTVLILMLTRVPQLPIKDFVMSTSPSFTLHLGSLCDVSLSASLVLMLSRILTTPSSFTYETLYVPCVLPFVVASAATLAVHWQRLDAPRRRVWLLPFREAWSRTAGTVLALAGALALAKLMRTGGAGSPAYILGYYFAALLGRGYVALAGLLGVLSSFAGGSVLAGNLTVGDIQRVAAVSIGVPVTSMLALQDAACAAGKMVCIANIAACKAVMKSELEKVHEGTFIRKAALPALLLVLVSTALSCVFMFVTPSGGYVWPDFPLPQ